MTSKLGFLVVRMFPVYSLLLAIESLRLANQFAARKAFDWTILSSDGEAVQASNGMTIEADCAVTEPVPIDYAFVISGDDQSGAFNLEIRNWLLRQLRNRVTLGAIDSGAFLLAQAKIATGVPMAIHPMSRRAYAESYPHLEMAKAAWTFDSGVMSCAGGVTVLPLMLRVIQTHCGQAVAEMVANDLMVPPELGSNGDPSGDRRGVPTATDAIHQAVALMEKTISEPISIDAVAVTVGLSTRDLTRRFRMRMNTSPGRHYLRIRLNHARQLLFQSRLSITEIAFATGFSSTSAFSRAFSAEFGTSPVATRNRLRRSGKADDVPLSQVTRRYRVPPA